MFPILRITHPINTLKKKKTIQFLTEKTLISQTFFIYLQKRFRIDDIFIEKNKK